ncbi:putative baseplate assembly protein [Nitrospira sp.]|nr:putative baseplate assembly protein [Nitrospira sp.]
MGTHYRCKNEERRRLVGATTDAQGNPIQPKLNGIDYLKVASTDQCTLDVFFLHNLPGQPNPVPPAAPALTKGNLVIEGGVRVRGIDAEVISISNNVLTVHVSEAGDYSIYTLRIITSPTSPDPPAGFDPQLSAVDFSFKVECPSDFDCEQASICPPPQFVEPEINYLAKDYSSFRRLVLDRMSTLMPNWRERNAADAQVALVEMMAYVGDHLSYFQDAVAAEAYLGTARRRVSVRRHARLLDYFVHDGANGRTWVTFEVTVGSGADGKTLPTGSMVLSRGSTAEIAVASADLDKALAEQPVVFETMHNLTLNAVHNSISFYTWSDRDCCLPKEATRATLLDKGLTLTVGDVMIFEEVLSPTTGLAADLDPSHRFAIRLKAITKRADPLDGTAVADIEWDPQDALPFPLCLTALVVDETGTPVVKEISIARGNVALADHGLRLTGEGLIPAEVPDEGNYRPQLQRENITFRVAYDDSVARSEPASIALEQDVRQALPAVTLNDGDEDWTPRRDLLNSGRFVADFVLETDRDSTAHLRFGDGVSAGKKPDGGTSFVATYRVGNGRAGNVGAEAISRIVSNFSGFQRVRNPLPARGGIDAETMEEVRQFAPQAFRTQQRAVTEADWAEVAGRHAEVQKAAATFRWTGSWYTVFITIDRAGGLSATGDPKFKAEIESFLEQFRVAGYDLEINDPVPVPLDILLRVCVKTGYFRSDVKQTLLNVFSRYDLPGGGRAFFHPDNFTFGQPVYLSKIYQTAMKVAGVASVEAMRFQRWGKLPDKELKNGRLVPASLEIIQLNNDPNFPENGQIDFEMHGGL